MEPQQKQILSYQPTYAITGIGGAKIIEATLNDFMLPEEFINAVCGALQRRGRNIRTMGDVASHLENLSTDDRGGLAEAGVLDVYVVGGDRPAPPEGKPFARVWSWREAVDDAIHIAVNISAMYDANAPTPIRGGVEGTT